jgi:uncharacterized integral membrane protein
VTNPPTSDGQPDSATGSSEVSAFIPPRAHRTRISGAWVAVIVAALVLVLLLVFILQNTESVRITYFSASGRMPLGVALLLAAVGGVLVAGVVASLRIFQLRRRINGPAARRSGRGSSAQPVVQR